MDKHRVIIDCDPGIDDALAIMLAARSIELQLEGITIAPGNVPTDIGAHNALRVLELLQASNIPVFAGAKEPLKHKLVPAYGVHGGDGLGDCGFPDTHRVPESDSAIEFLVKKAAASSKDISLICLGPLTNLAHAIERAGEKVANLKEVIIMGGALRVPGNVTPVAEFNFWTDPEAARRVFHWGKVPITLISLDVTRKVLLSPNHRELLRHLKTPLCHWVRRITRHYLDAHWRLDGILGCTLNDPVAIGALVMANLIETTPYHLDVATDGLCRGELTAGVGDESGDKRPVRLVTNVDCARFVEEFLVRIAGGELTVSDLRRYLPYRS